MITIAECTIRMGMRCMFNQDYTEVGGKDTWENIYTEFMDISTLAQNRVTELEIAIHNTKIRLIGMESHINLQRKAIETFGFPFGPGGSWFRKYGHRLTWNGNKENFLQQVKMVEIKEKRFVAELDKLEKELNDLQTNGVKENNNTRGIFMQLLSDVQRHQRYHLDKDKIMMDEFAYMIKDFLQAKPKNKDNE